MIPSKLATAEEAAEFDRIQARISIDNRLKHAGIPSKYKNADITMCLPEIQAYAEAFDGNTSWGLFLHGGVGRGKTYAACAILNHVVRQFSARFEPVGGLLHQLRATFGGMGSKDDIIDGCIGTRLIVLDDFGKEKQTEWALSTLFAIVDGRYSRGKPTIITSQYDYPELGLRLASEGNYDTAEAIVSRLFESCTPILFDGDDRRCRVEDDDD